MGRKTRLLASMTEYWLIFIQNTSNLHIYPQDFHHLLSIYVFFCAESISAIKR